MKVIIPGGSGHVGAALIRHFVKRKDEVVLLSRRAERITGVRAVAWDGATLGDWSSEIDGADVIVNLAGRSVNCRYSATNLDDMMTSRVNSTRVIGEAIAQAKRPPALWLQASTATIYPHRYDAANDETSPLATRDLPGEPRTWQVSVDIALAWEETLDRATTPLTRKVALRSSMTMSPDRGSVFAVMASLAKKGLFGRIGDGNQFVSWIHEVDYCRALDFLIEHDDMSGPVNICSPNPLAQAEFAQVLREAVGARFGLPTPKPLLEIGTFLMKTESELVLKSRRVVPARLMNAGFEFQFPTWSSAARDLVARSIRSR